MAITLLDKVFDFEAKRGNEIWLTQPVGGGATEDLTWREAVGEARRMAAHLRSLDLPPRSNVALLGKNSAHWILADLAIWLAGHVAVPIYPTLTAASVRQILEHSEARLLFVGKLDDWAIMREGVAPSLPRIALPLAPETAAAEPGTRAWKDIAAATAPLEGRLTRPAEELATIIYTSGSTGVPKGVMVSFGTMASLPVAAESLFEIRPDDRMLSYLPLAHAMERGVVEAASMYYGGRLFFAERLDTFVQDLKRARPTIFVSVPRLWLKFQQGVLAKVPQQKLDRLLAIPGVSWFIRRKILRGLGLDKVRVAISGSAPMPADLLAWYRRLGLELLEGYGMTENFSYSHCSRLGEVRPGYVGTPSPGVEARFSASGELEVKSPGMMMGYYKAPDLTAEVITPDGFLRTGDRGDVDEQGRLRITGRVKELFKTSKGKYVAPVPIENALLTSTLFESACVSGSGMPQPYAVVSLGESARAAADRATIERAIAAHLEAVNRGLDPHEALEFLLVASKPWTIESGLLTPTLKIKRAAIEETYAAIAEKSYDKGAKVVWEA